MLEDLYYTCRIDMNMQFSYVDFTGKSFAVVILMINQREGFTVLNN